MNNKTYGDLMSEYVAAKEQAKRFGSWEQLDKFAETVVNQVSPKPEKAFDHKFQEYTYDSMGAEVHE